MAAQQDPWAQFEVLPQGPAAAPAPAPTGGDEWSQFEVEVPREHKFLKSATEGLNELGLGAVSGLLNPVGMLQESGNAMLQLGVPDVYGKYKFGEGLQQWNVGGNPYVGALTDPTNLLGGGLVKNGLKHFIENGGPAVLRNIFTSETSTGGGELGQKLSEGTSFQDSPLASIGGSIFGGLAGHWATSPPVFSGRPLAEERARMITGHHKDTGKPVETFIPEENFYEAAQKARTAKDQFGIDATWPQFMPRTTASDEMSRVYTTPSATALQAKINAQPDQVRTAGDKFAKTGQIGNSPKLYGDVVEKQVAANNAMDALETTIKEKREEAKDVFRSVMGNEQVKISQDLMQQTEARLQELKKKYDKQPGQQAIIQDVIDSLSPTHQPEFEEAAKGYKTYTRGTGRGDPIPQEPIQPPGPEIPNPAPLSITRGQAIPAPSGVSNPVPIVPGGQYEGLSPAGRVNSQGLVPMELAPGVGKGSSSLTELNVRPDVPPTPPPAPLNGGYGPIRDYSGGREITVRDGMVRGSSGGIPGTRRAPRKIYFDDPGEVNYKVQSALDGEGQNAVAFGKGINHRADAKVVAEIRNVVFDAYNRSGSNIKKAKDAYLKFMRENYDPITKFLSSYTRGGRFDQNLNANKAPFFHIFEEGVSNNLNSITQSNIVALADALHRAGPKGDQAFEDLFRTWLDSTTQAARETAGPGVGKEAFGISGKLRDSLGKPGTTPGGYDKADARTRVINAASKILLRNRGYSPEEIQGFTRGLHQLRQTIQAGANLPETLNMAQSGVFNQQKAGGTVVEKVAESQATSPGWLTAKLSKLSGAEKADRILSQLLASNDPESIRKLIQMGKTGKWDRSLAALIATTNATGRTFNTEVSNEKR